MNTNALSIKPSFEIGGFGSQCKCLHGCTIQLVSSSLRSGDNPRSVSGFDYGYEKLSTLYMKQARFLESLLQQIFFLLFLCPKKNERAIGESNFLYPFNTSDN